MLGYYYDNADRLYNVINRDGYIFAQFATEAEARDYCEKHNAQVEV